MAEDGANRVDALSASAAVVSRDAAKRASAEVGKLNVFISYSRDDLDFADQLEAALKLTGFDPTIDRHGISGGEASAHQRIRGSTLVTFPELGHSPQVQDPVQFNKALLKELSSLK